MSEWQGILTDIKDLRYALALRYSQIAEVHIQTLDALAIIEDRVERELARTAHMANEGQPEVGTCVICQRVVELVLPTGADDPDLRILAKHEANPGSGWNVSCAGSYGTPVERFESGSA